GQLGCYFTRLIDHRNHAAGSNLASGSQGGPFRHGRVATIEERGHTQAGIEAVHHSVDHFESLDSASDLSDRDAIYTSNGCRRKTVFYVSPTGDASFDGNRVVVYRKQENLPTR